MKIFRKVTLKYLKKNKVRTFATIMGILLSTAMLCAVTTFLSSMNAYITENAIHNTGDWQAAAMNVDWETYQRISQQSEITDLVAAQRVGYAKIEENEREFKSYYYLLGADKDFMERLCSHLTEGRLPRAEKEILLPESFMKETGIVYEIGDKLILQTGKRMYRSTQLWQDDPYTFFVSQLDYEGFNIEVTNMYTVVGFYDGISYKLESAAAPGYTVYTCYEAEGMRTEYYPYDVFFNIEDGDQIYAFAEKNGLTEENDIEMAYNVEVLGIEGVLLQGSLGNMSTILTVFVMGLILLGAIALIYNMFSISVSERTKQFGLLSSVGATQKQIQGMVLYESLVVSVVGIPLGILAGIGAIGIAVQFIGDKFQALGYVLPMTMHVSIGAVVAAVIIALLTVLVSAWLPSKRAMKATIIETIKQNKDIYQQEKEGTKSRVAGKIFGISGMLAGNYCRRSKKKFQTTALGLLVSTILFVLVSFFMDYILRAVEQHFNENSYDVAFFYDTKLLEEYDQDEFFELLKQEEHITDATYTTSNKSYLVEMDKRYLSQWALENPGTLTREYRLKPDIVTMTMNITFIQDEKFKELLQEYDLSEEDFMNMEQPKAIVIDGALNANTNSSVQLLAGDTCEAVFTRGIYKKRSTGWYELVEQIVFNLEGGKTIYERPYYVEEAEGLIFLYPESVRQYYLALRLEKGEEPVDPWGPVPVSENDFSRLIEDDICNCKFLTSDADATFEALKQIAEEHELTTNNFANNAEKIEKEKNLISIIEVLALGFIVLMSLVAAINVFNTISTNIGLRRREFAVLKSIGMTERDLNRMLFVECMLLSGQSLLYGLPTAFLGTWLIHLGASMVFDVSYQFPWMSLLIAVVAILLIVLFSMFYITRTRKKENVLEALKNENI